DQRQGFAGGNAQADAVDRMNPGEHPSESRGPGREMLGEVPGFEKRGHATSLSSGARRQRETWPGPIAARLGAAARQAGSAKGQRGAKRHPLGGAVMFGTLPLIAASRSLRMSSRGIEPSRPTV